MQSTCLVVYTLQNYAECYAECYADIIVIDAGKMNNEEEGTKYNRTSKSHSRDSRNYNPSFTIHPKKLADTIGFTPSP